VVGHIRFALERCGSPRHISHVAQLWSLGGSHTAMKTLAIILITVIVAGGLFAVGWRFGYHQHKDIRAYAIPLVDRRLGDAASKAEILHLMDLGHYSDARYIVQGQFNMDILEVDSLESDSDIHRQDLARRICAKILDYRSAYPSNYVSDPAFGQAWIEGRVDSYLKKAATKTP
jgi:hypothetical protein